MLDFWRWCHLCLSRQFCDGSITYAAYREAVNRLYRLDNGAMRALIVRE